MSCEKVITAKLDTSTCVELAPAAEVGPIESSCIGEPHLEKYPDFTGGPHHCTYMVTQILCVRFPLRIYTDIKPSPGRNCIPPILRCMLMLYCGVRL